MNVENKWEFVDNIDLSKRKPLEWAEIYNLKLFGDIPNEIWSEYEWAYNLFNLKYMPLPDRDNKGKILDSNYKSETMEMRAMEIKRDLFCNADDGEKLVLEDKYIETKWVHNKLNLNM